MEEYNNNNISKVIIVNYKNNNYQFSTELIKPINILYNEICSYFNINPNNYSFYYNKQKLITDNNNQQLYNIIDNDSNPFFKIIPNKIPSFQKLNINPAINSSKKFNSITSRKKQSSNFKLKQFIRNNIRQFKLFASKKFTKIIK